MLQAMLRPRFSLFKVERPHETAGLVMNDLLRSENLWLMDESLERSARVGVTFAMRLTQPKDFAMTCGVMVPVSRELWDAAYAELPSRLHGAPVEIADDRRLATALYRHAVLGGLMREVDFVHPTDQPDEDAI